VAGVDDDDRLPRRLGGGQQREQRQEADGESAHADQSARPPRTRPSV
jgi:hypothetical protein